MTEDGYNNRARDEFEASQRIGDLAAETKQVSLSYDFMRPLGSNFPGPGPYDVICGRGRKTLAHPGNSHYRSKVSEALDQYARAKSKMEKSQIVSSIVDEVRALSPQGGFIRQIDGQWFEVG